jgi:tRNA-dihydrouridine synthase B
MAPMAKLGNTAFRKLVSDFGGYGLLFSEMCWAGSVPCGNGHDQGGFTWRPEEDLSELVCQLFGRDPETMARATGIVAAEGFFGVDLNFGCAVAAVCKKGCGAALLKTPDRAAAIVDAVRRAATVPVFVKFRTGWEDDPETAVTNWRGALKTPARMPSPFIRGWPRTAAPVRRAGNTSRASRTPSGSRSSATAMFSSAATVNR